MVQHARRGAGRRRPVCRTWPPAVAAALALTLPMAAGCARQDAGGRQDAAAAGAGAAGRVPILLRTTDLRLPLDAYLLSLDDQW